MKFKTPRLDIDFEINDTWLSFCATEESVSDKNTYYPYTPAAENVEVVELSKIKPPSRDKGIEPFRKCKLVPILLAFQSPECALPPIEVENLGDTEYLYSVINGYHRYYASVYVEYDDIPVIVKSKVTDAP